MMYINEETMELVVHFVEEYEDLEDDIVDFVEESMLCVEVNSYEDHKYWIKCRNGFELDILWDIIEDKLERLTETY